jgi:hypothetical protein
MDSRGCPKSKKDDAVTCGKAEKSSGGSRMGADANRVSIPNPPIAKVSPLPSAPSNHGPFADNFSQCANLSLNVCSQSRPRGVAFRSTLPHHPAQVPRFQELGFQVPQNKRIATEPRSQRIENREFVLKHTGGGDAPLSPARKDFKVNECRCVTPSGLLCQLPAMRGSSFCCFHACPQCPARSRQALAWRICELVHSIKGAWKPGRQTLRPA